MTALPAYDAWKRGIDVGGALVLIVVTAPVQALAALAVRWTMGSPVLFRQPRVGRDERVFVLVKLRSMRAADAGAGLVTDGERLTRLGRFLRATSIDELPTLWNVLRGEMSLVGPRPLLVDYLDRYSSEQRRRHEVRPGVTGLAQVAGRNSVPWERRLALDVEYVDRHSLAVDLRILGQTVLRALRRDGISATGEATMSEFTGGQDPPT